MIVITSLNQNPIYVCAGDTFQLTITDDMDCQVVISENITTQKTINFTASYRFALEDGTCPGFHLSGVFANKDELPKELADAKMLDQLTETQYENFARTVGIKIKERGFNPRFSLPEKSKK